jgi:hypothetical protein
VQPRAPKGMSLRTKRLAALVRDVAHRFLS